jgi:ribosomal protein L37AE/L43A
LDECPKCGALNSFTGPTYQTYEAFVDVGSNAYVDGVFREWLVWKCETCGYEVEGPTADAVEAGAAK